MASGPRYQDAATVAAFCMIRCADEGWMVVTLVDDRQCYTLPKNMALLENKATENDVSWLTREILRVELPNLFDSIKWTVEYPLAPTLFRETNGSPGEKIGTSYCINVLQMKTSLSSEEFERRYLIRHIGRGGRATLLPFHKLSGYADQCLDPMSDAIFTNAFKRKDDKRICCRVPFPWSNNSREKAKIWSD